MNLCATFPVTIDGTEIILKPLTVRQRLAFGNTLVERERQKSLEAGKAAGLTGRDLADLVAESARGAERVSFVVASCFTLEGALMVLALASTEKDAERIGNAMEPGDVGVLAARCMGVSFEAKATAAGN